MRLAVAAGAVFVCILAACSGPYSNPKVSAKEDTPVVPVKLERLALANIPEIITVTGELFAEEQATISAKVPGRVQRLHVDLGSVVTQGQVVAELEKDDYELRVRQAEALVAQTRARLGILDSPSDDVKPEETAVDRKSVV